NIFVDVGVGEPDHRPAARLEKGRAARIVGTLLFGAMRCAVDLDDDLAADMREVGNIGMNGVLAAEFVAMAVGFAKTRPEDQLGFRHGVAHGSRAPKIVLVGVAHGWSVLALTRNSLCEFRPPASLRSALVRCRHEPRFAGEVRSLITSRYPHECGSKSERRSPHPKFALRISTSPASRARLFATYPKHHVSTAFCACRRFSASSKTTLCGPSITSSLTSSPRWAGRQCMKMASLAARAIRRSLTW